MGHPDLANPPVYPVVLAGLMKVLPFRYPVDLSHGFWSIPNYGMGGKRVFIRYQPDFLIALFNEALLLALVALVFRLARRLFDAPVAWLSAVLLLGTELLWRFSVSGLSTMLLMVIFVGLVWCLVLLEEDGRTPTRGPRGELVLAALIGLFLGVGALTRYAFGWLVLPVAGFVLLYGGVRRVRLALVMAAVFAALLTPWVARNFHVSGTPFGTASYAVMEGTAFQENHLERSLEPGFGKLSLWAYWVKLIGNTRQILQTDLPKLGGSWTTAFFLVGLLVNFRSPALQRLRYFLLGCIVMLTAAQALGRTHLSEDSPEINTENLLVLLAPLALVYGVSLFYVLLDQMVLPFGQVRYLVIGLFGVGACLPMVFVFLPPRTSPVAYPPYHPPAIQALSRWTTEKELLMSDIPWAVAWYGQRQCVWLTLRATPDPKDADTTREDFSAINDYLKPISVLYLTPQTMDSKFLTQWFRADEKSWGGFIIQSLVKEEIPESFPLHKMPGGWLPEQLVLTDRERWNKDN
jgi:hypothetical protein